MCRTSRGQQATITNNLGEDSISTENEFEVVISYSIEAIIVHLQ